MENIKNKNIYALLKNSLFICLTVVSAVVLPQILHTFGIAVGLNDTLGQMFLPMYLPVMILAFKTNAICGIVAGALSPIISYVLSGMPNAKILPFIIIELICFGLFAGLLSNKKLNPFVKILTVQILSKAVRIAAVLVSLYFIKSNTVTVAATLNTTLIALPGLILQFLVVPWFIKKEK